jgi:hypothetical protein
MIVNNLPHHVKVYFDYFDFVTQSEAMCEACHRPGVDIHHINGRGKGKDVIDNLMCLCRSCHEKAHSSKDHISKEVFQMIHNYFLMGDRRKFIK